MDTSATFTCPAYPEFCSSTQVFDKSGLADHIFRDHGITPNKTYRPSLKRKALEPKVVNGALVSTTSVTDNKKAKSSSTLSTLSTADGKENVEFLA